MQNYYGGPKGLQGIQGEQGIKGFDFQIKGIIQENTCKNINDVLNFTPDSAINLPSYEKNQWLVYYFIGLKISFGYSKDIQNTIQKIFIGYQHSGFWADNNIDLLKISAVNSTAQENGNINFNFLKDSLNLSYKRDNQIKEINLLDKFNKKIITPSNLKVDKKGNYYLSVFDKQLNGWLKVSTLSDNNICYYEKTNEAHPTREVTFSLSVSNCPDFTEDITETFTVQIGSKLSSIESQSIILRQMNDDGGYYNYVTVMEGYEQTIFTVNGSTNADVAYEGALGPNDIIDETWHGRSFPVVEAH